MTHSVHHLCDCWRDYMTKLERVVRAAKIACKELPKEPPERNEWTGNSDDDYDSGYALGKWSALKEIREALAALESSQSSEGEKK